MSHLPTPTPTSDEPDVPGLVVPNEKTIAFAVSVVKSKPPELSIEGALESTATYFGLAGRLQ